MEMVPLSAKQAMSIEMATARINLWDGAVRSGKSIAADLAFANACLNHDRRHGAIVISGKTQPTIESNVIEPLREMLGAKALRHTAGSLTGTIFKKKFRIRSANDARSEHKIRGDTIGLWYGDEITLWPESFFMMGLSRMSPPGARFFGTTNPDNPNHWLKKKFIDRRDLDMRRFHFTLDDNESLTEEYKNNLKREFTGLWFKRFVLGLWVIAEGAVWESFDPDKHVIDELPAGVDIHRWIVGIDYGTANPFVALLIGQGTDGVIYVFDELRWDSRERERYHGFQKSDSQLRQMLTSWLEHHGVTPAAIWMDPSAASFAAELQNHNVPNVCGANNDVPVGLRVVGNRFSKNEIMILSRCYGLIGEIPGYCWDPKALERGKEEPIKVADHGCDALRYPVLSEYGDPYAGLVEHMRREIAQNRIVQATIVPGQLPPGVMV